LAITTDTLQEAALQAENEAAADFTELQIHAYMLGEMIKQSALADEYVYWKQKLAQDDEAKRAAKKLAQAKAQFAECERFGRYHPDYHEALNRVKAAEAEANSVETVRRFKQAEEQLDELLHEVSLILARAVSESVKVPDDRENVRGCGGGGSCSCSGGCG
jgi:cell fate (sporulation/competence/biofilm development) regulator YlbF (YheA/YmcA/DUF963 family)